MRRKALVGDELTPVSRRVELEDWCVFRDRAPRAALGASADAKRAAHFETTARYIGEHSNGRIDGADVT